MIREAYMKLYFLVPKDEAEDAKSMGGIKVEPDEKARNRFIQKVRIKPNTDLWYFVGMELPKQTRSKWAFVTFEIVPEVNEFSEEEMMDKMDVRDKLEDWLDVPGDNKEDEYNDMIPPLKVAKGDLSHDA